MDRVRLRRIAWTLIAAVCVAALSAPVSGGRDVIVQNGDRIESVLADGSDRDAFRVRTPPGARLEVRARARDRSLRLTVVLRTEDEPGELERDEGRSVRVRTKTAEARTVIAEISTAAVDALEPIRYDVTFRWRVPRRRGYRLETGGARDPGPDPLAVFHAGAGETARISVRSPRGGARVLYSIDSNVALVAYIGTRVHDLMLPFTTWYRVSVSSPYDAVSIVTVRRRRGRRQFDLSDAAIQPADGGAILGLIGGDASTVFGASSSVSGLSRVVLVIPPGERGGRRPITLSVAPNLVQPAPGIARQFSAVHVGPDELAVSQQSPYELTMPVSDFRTVPGISPRVFVRNIDGTVAEVPDGRIRHRRSERLVTISHVGPGTFQVFGARRTREGVSVAATDDWIAVGLPGATVDGYVNAGVVEVYRRGASGWELETVLRRSAPRDEDTFGFRLAASDDTLVVSVPGLSYRASGVHAGLVYERSDAGEWSLADELDSAGESLEQVMVSGGATLTASGDVVAAGSFYERTAVDGARVPVVLVFERASGQWELTQRISRDAIGSGFGRFGHFLASTDGVLVLGSGPSFKPPFSRGGASVFVRDSETGEWAFEALLTPPSVAAGCDSRSLDNYYPTSVAVDGDSLVLGLVQSVDFGASAEGAACLYRRENETWNLVTTVQPQHRVNEPVFPCPEIDFGASVSVAGSRVLVGAPRLRSIDPGGFSGGGAYLYRLIDDAAQFEAVYEAVPHAAFRALGRRVALLPSGDGAVLVGLSEIDPSDPRGIGRALVIDLD